MKRQPTFIAYVTGQPGDTEHDTLLRAADRLEAYDRLDHALSARISDQLTDRQLESAIANVSDPAITLADLIVEAAYRQRNLEYRIKDAWRHLSEIIDDNPDEYGAIPITDDDAAYVAQNFIDEYDCNVAENDLFDRVCYAYLNDLRARGYAGEPTPEIHPGDYVIYQKPGASTYELGRVKRRTPSDSGWFCWYSDGDTAANTPDEYLRPVSDQNHPMADGPFANIFTSPETLGGSDAQNWFEEIPQVY